MSHETIPLIQMAVYCHYLFNYRTTLYAKSEDTIMQILFANSWMRSIDSYVLLFLRQASSQEVFSGYIYSYKWNAIRRRCTYVAE